MHQEAKELHRFMLAIHAEPSDLTTRRVFADWLDDHDEPELAQEQREFCTDRGQAMYHAEKRLRKVAEDYANGDYAGMMKGLASGDYCFSDEGFRFAIDWAEVWEDVETLTNVTATPFVRDGGNFSCSC
jgi:uncharacterized protein (TIGR02996 family)